MKEDNKEWERIEKLRALFTEEEFESWLEAPNKHIVGNKSPNDLIREGNAEAVGDLVEAIITGCPM
jgi:uncharacterized protein (DUF2384 family)